MKKFGKTWWGEQFLNSLKHIDWENRIPRGSAYAGRGAVREIKINKSKIEARVQGSRPTPYKIRITIPEFTEQQKEILTKAVQENPFIMAELLNKELPKEINDIALQHKIQIFPTKWNDYDMHCSCPDWAVPCKHLAAVLYILSKEIDNNPFQIFNLHGFNILKTVNKKDNSKIEVISEIPKISEFIVDVQGKAGVTKDANRFDNIDFTKLEPISDSLLQLLSPEPIFFNTDFKLFIEKMYKSVSKEINKKYFKNPTQSSPNVQIPMLEDIKFDLDEDINLNKILLYLNNDIEALAGKTGINTLIELLEQIQPKSYSKLPDSLLALTFAFRFSLFLCLNGSYIPQILQQSNDKYIIRWIPALINEQVKHIFEQILKITPNELIIITGKKKTRLLNPQELLISLISLFLKYFISQYFFYSNNSKDEICEFFFRGNPIIFKKLGEEKYADSIHQWLQNYYIAHKDYAPIIKVDDVGKNNYEVSVLIENKNASLKAPVPLERFIRNPENIDKKWQTLRDLNLLSKSFPELKKIISTLGKERLKFDSNIFTKVLLNILPVIKLYGIGIFLPTSMKTLLHPKLSLSLRKKSSAKTLQKYLDFDSLVDFQWEIAIGDELISLSELKKLASEAGGIIKYKDNYLIINESDIEKLTASMKKVDTPDSNELIKIALSGEYNDAKIGIPDEIRQIINDLIQSQDISLPDELNASLRPYQIRGYQWLYKNSKVGFGSIIADDMGLGKTLQVLTFLLQMKKENRLEKEKALVVVPTSLLTNWQSEISRFTPSLSSHIYHGAKRELKSTDADIILTTYGITRSDIDNLQKEKWAVVVVDEAQNIKNSDTEHTKAVKKLKSKIKIAMSGTPVENRLSEYWSIFDFTNHGYLGNPTKFRTEFAMPIEIYRDQHKLDKFKKITAPFILRRLKTDKSIISDLPDKIINDCFTSLSKEQTALYKSVVDNMLEQIKSVKTDTPQSKIARSGLILKMIINLKQICNHPVNYLKKGKLDSELSGKSTFLIQQIENIIENDEKVLIFSQFTEMGNILKEIIEKETLSPVLFLHGALDRKKRDELVESFQNNKKYKIFMLSLKAGGTGLNLTSASNVIHYDLWWNPAVENQATDRAFRIGQKKNVMVYRYITKGTFEEKINTMIQNKKELADLSVVSGEKWIGELTNKELAELVS